MATRPDVPCLALVSLLLAAPASAAPPPVGSDDWQIMHPFAEWVTTQHDRRGYWCCDIGDGRPVDAHIAMRDPSLTAGTATDAAWWAHITPAHFPNETDRWIVIPDGKITAGGNPTGSPILWLLHGNVQCFAPPDQG